MKALNKILLIIMLVILCVSFSLTACNNGNNDDNGGTGTPEEITTAMVVSESVSYMENMIFGNNTQEQISKMSFVQPNREVDYGYELESILRGSGTGMYFSKSVVSIIKDFSDNTTYIDNIEQGGYSLHFLVKSEKVSGGVLLDLQMNQNEEINPIQISYKYDYTAKRPIRTTIKSISEGDEEFGFAVAQFDYLNNLAMSFEFEVDKTNEEQVKTALSAKTFDYSTFSGCEVSYYKFAKIDLSKKTIEAFSYDEEEIGENISATEVQLSTLYNDIYNSVKDDCEIREYLDSTNAVEKEYYTKMYSYTSLKAMAFVIDKTVYSAYLDLDGAKNLINLVETELQKEKYATGYDEVKADVAKVKNYLSTLTVDSYLASITEDDSVISRVGRYYDDAGMQISYIIMPQSGLYTIQIDYLYKTNTLGEVSIIIPN